MASAAPSATRDLTPGPGASLRNAPFILLCVSVFLCYTHQSLIYPVLALYFDSLGGTPLVVGLVLGAFSVLSFGMRPLVGWATDRWSTHGVMLVGTLLLGSCGLAFVVPSLWLAALANAFRGLGWGAINTAGATVLARIVPPQSRASATGYYSIATNTAGTLAPALALWLVGTPGFGFAAVFVVAGSVALLATLAARLLAARTPLPAVAVGRPQLMGVIDRGVLLPAAVSVFATVTYPITVAFVPLYARSLGIEDLGWYFVAGGVATVVTRLGLGSLVDRGGRGWWIAGGLAIMAAGLVLLMLAGDVQLIVIGGIAYGVGAALANPGLMALAVDRADPTRPGVAMATFSMNYQLGMLFGSPLSGALLEWAGFTAMFLGGVGALGVAGVILVVRWRAFSQSAATIHRI